MAGRITFTVLAIDDDVDHLFSLQRVLRGSPYRVVTADDGEKGLALLEEEQVDLVLLDRKMPGRSGMDILEDIVNLYPGIPVIMLTGHGNVQDAVYAIKQGAVDFLEKPCAPEVLIKRLQAFLTARGQYGLAADKEDADAFDYPDLLGDSPVMLGLKALIVRVADSEAPVLIVGESGTGKELVARAIHSHSDRSQADFVAIDCAAISESVLESELFGYVKGAFTGADQAVPGLIRTAHGGTLFLDEIGELPVSMQAKLLRTLQEREVRPVGGVTNHRVNIRVIAATNRNLEEETAGGKFRSDLYYRISALPVMLPPLRDRPGDIALLARHFLANQGDGRSWKIDEEALQLLKSYSWPGNVRELENVLSRAMVLCKEQTIGVVDLPATLALPDAVQVEEKSGDDSLASYEKLAIENALKKCGYNKRHAAALLGIGEATLYRKLKLHGLSK